MIFNKKQIGYLLIIILFIIPCIFSQTFPKVPYDIFDESPEAGGPGFTGTDWQTASDTLPLIGDSVATKGGTFRLALDTFPTTLRTIGKEARFTMNGVLKEMMYESLLKIHANTLDYIPSIATHWQILRDSKTFRFRINPLARWSDGTPITTNDVIASWKLHSDEALEDPNITQIYSKFYKPVAESKYIFHVTAKELSWLLFDNFAVDMAIYPASALENLSTKEFLAEYDQKLMPNSGPYRLLMEEIEPGKKMVLERRTDYWAKDQRYNLGLYNFDRLEWIIAKRATFFELFKKGEIDLYFVTEAEFWLKGTDFDEIKRGLIQKRKIYNKAPLPWGGIAFNLRRFPLDDVNVRKALALLFNREKMIEQFFYNEYALMDSYFPGSVYANPKNVPIRFNFDEAVKLLQKSGWKKNKNGILVNKDNKPLELTFIAQDTLVQRGILKIFQDDLAKAGIKLNLVEADNKTRKNAISEQKFDLISAIWGGSLKPNPQDFWNKDLADTKDSNNICGMKLDKIARICDVHRRSFLRKQQIETLRELDSVLIEQHPYILGWAADYQRILYWNRFRIPPGYFTKMGNYFDAILLWSVNPGKEDMLKQAQENNSMTMPLEAVEQKYWLRQN